MNTTVTQDASLTPAERLCEMTALLAHQGIHSITEHVLGNTLSALFFRWVYSIAGKRNPFVNISHMRAVFHKELPHANISRVSKKHGKVEFIGESYQLRLEYEKGSYPTVSATLLTRKIPMIYSTVHKNHIARIVISRDGVYSTLEGISSFPCSPHLLNKNLKPPYIHYFSSLKVSTRFANEQARSLHYQCHKDAHATPIHAGDIESAINIASLFENNPRHREFYTNSQGREWVVAMPVVREFVHGEWKDLTCLFGATESLHGAKRNPFVPVPLSGFSSPVFHHLENIVRPLLDFTLHYKIQPLTEFQGYLPFSSLLTE